MATEEQQAETAALPNAQQDFINAFESATNAIKQYEQKRKLSAGTTAQEDDSPVASHNELRYAARHLLDAITPEQSAKSNNEQWVRAKRHADRASYDVAEFEISLLVKRINAIRTQFAPHGKHLANSIVNYYTHLKNYNAYLNYLAETHELDKESEAYKNQCATYVLQLEAFWNDILAGKVLLCNNIARESADAVTLQRWGRFVFCIFVVAGLLIPPFIDKFIAWVAAALSGGAPSAL